MTHRAILASIRSVPDNPGTCHVPKTFTGPPQRVAHAVVCLAPFPQR